VLTLGGNSHLYSPRMRDKCAVCSAANDAAAPAAAERTWRAGADCRTGPSLRETMYTATKVNPKGTS